MDLNINFFIIIVISCSGSANEIIPDSKAVFDLQLYKNVSDPELCEQQMAYLRNDSYLLSRFLDAGIRIPKGFLDGNFYDYGNYYQCLAIDEVLPDSTIQGKYCSVTFPLNQNITLPEFILPELSELLPKTDEYMNSTQERFSNIGPIISRFSMAGESPFANLSVFLAVCIPKACSTKQFLEGLPKNLTQYGLQYKEQYCRLPQDKQWVSADYVAIVVFSLLLVLVVISTGYDVFYTVVKGQDSKCISKFYSSFSIYTNTRRLVTYNAAPGTIECLDGVRVLAMMWIITGHTVVNQTLFPLANPMAVLDWITSMNSIWIALAPMTVDTFFMISGLLLVYTTVGKLNRSRLIKNLHLFYLNRLLRLFPILAACTLLMASFPNRIWDGPNWTLMSSMTENCRVYWWPTLLHIQNWYNIDFMCLPHSWYLAIDVQLYIISPIILFWVLGKQKRSAWIALISSLLLVLVGSTIYNSIFGFQSAMLALSRTNEDQQRYLRYYYINTLTRASPFFVGMIYGYLLHLCRGKKVIFSKVSTTILWLIATVIFIIISILMHLIMMKDWDNQMLDNLINSLMKPAWALAVGWIIFACDKGYGGPINWVLSLRSWKVLSRLSYAMYIVHFPLILIVESSVLSPIYFSIPESLFKFLAIFTLSAIAAYILTLLVDAPCSTLIKMAMGGGYRRTQPQTELTTKENENGGTENHAFEEESSTKTIRL